MRNFRENTPTRTCTKTYQNYRSYKKFLVSDFNTRCGYCDSSDTWYGGFRHFQIDHFAPKDKFPIFQADYKNLIYACPSCNGAKSNKWPSTDATQNRVGDEGFLNPVNDNLNDHFERDDFGNILPKTTIAFNMCISLKLCLERHGVLWMLSKLEKLIGQYELLLLNSTVNMKFKPQVEQTHYLLLKIFFEYQQKLKSLNM